VVLVKRVMGRQWALPGGFMLEAGVNPVLRKAFGLDKESVGNHDDLKMVEKMLQRSEVIFQGYMEDPRNTDNAWVETKISHIHATGSTMQNIYLMASTDPNVVQVSWAVVHKRMNLYAQHAHALEAVVKKLGAFW
jgi:ADP-ribose pyrophosphatase